MAAFHRIALLACLAVLLGAIGSVAAAAARLPPRNPWLADSSYPIGNGNPAQQASS